MLARSPLPRLDRAVGWMKQTLSATNTRIQVGLELYSVFLAAELPGPKLRMDALIGGGSEFPSDILAAAIQSLLPMMEKLQIATSAEVEVSTLAKRMSDEVIAGKGMVFSPGSYRSVVEKTVKVRITGNSCGALDLESGARCAARRV